jgi:hypothetical protein
MAVMSLSFENNGTAHNDLVLRLDQFERRCDTYYLALDNLFVTEKSGAEKVRLVLIRLLQLWRDAVIALHHGMTHLPYEFDDQATGWLQISLDSGDAVEVLPVWSALEGWAISPSAFLDDLERIGKVTSVWKNLSAQRMTRQELLERIETSIEAASAQRMDQS